MFRYRVVLFYHGSATYDIEAIDDDAAVEAAGVLAENESDADFNERLSLERIYGDYDLELIE